MTSKNDITGDDIKSRSTSEEYRENWDRIFKNPSPPSEDEPSKSTDDNQSEA